jgi:hypothetical protein
MLKFDFPYAVDACVDFAHILSLYASRGHALGVACAPDAHVVFAGSGVEVTADRLNAVPIIWREPPSLAADATWDHPWRWSALGMNVSVPPLPDVGSPGDLWDEYCRIRLNVWPHVRPEEQTQAAKWLDALPRPIILLSTAASTHPRRNLDHAQSWQLCRQLLKETDGTLVLLEDAAQEQRWSHQRVRYVADEWQTVSPALLISLIGRADLLIAVDDTPLQLARLTDTPAIGIWLPDECSPARCAPRDRQVNLLVRHPRSWRRQSRTAEWSREGRVALYLVECGAPDLMLDALLFLVRCMLAPPRYLHAALRGADALLQWFVRQRMSGELSSLGGYSDRERSFDKLLRTMTARFPDPQVVETGCIRAQDDFSGAGFSTYVFGCYLSKHGGSLVSVDNDPEHCTFARLRTQCFGDIVRIVQSDSAAWLRSNRERIDVLYLDSSDVKAPGAADHCLAEIMAAYGRLRATSLVVLDDTVYRGGTYRGKGALAAPWLLERGWKVVESGHQTILACRPFEVE